MATTRDTEQESFLLESEVRGYHIYKSTWTPVVGTVLHIHSEPTNSHDPYAVAVIQDGQIVGHMPRKI